MLQSRAEKLNYLAFLDVGEPETVQNLTCSGGSRNIALKWQPGDSGNEMQRFVVRVKADQSCAVSQLQSESETSSSNYTYFDVYPYCQYDVSVAAKNTIGYSVLSRVNCSTLPDGELRLLQSDVLVQLFAAAKLWNE